MAPKRTALLLLSLAASAVAAEPDVYFTGDFETGQLQRSGESHDGFFLKTLPNPQGNVKQVAVGRGGAGPDSGLDARVVSKEVPPGSGPAQPAVTPRKGNYFLRTAIYFDKKYDGFRGNERRNKPRTSLIAKQPSQKFDYDVEGWTGFSIFLPANIEDETGKSGGNGKNMLMNISAPGAAEMFALSYWVPSPVAGEGDDTVSHWWIEISHSTKSTDRDQVETIDLGSIVPDKGKWTDFVIRWRSNPFSTNTNPALARIPNAKDQLYLGNKGILQLWKAQGSSGVNGNRPMVLQVNKVNTPIGLVPHKSWKLGHSFRQYKYGWHQQPTDVKGPVWIGFDEIRYGLASRDGTGFDDVYAACVQTCATNSAMLPSTASASLVEDVPQPEARSDDQQEPAPPAEIVVIP